MNAPNTAPAARTTRRPRIRFEGDVLFRVPRRGRPVRARARNLSSAGIAIATDQPPEAGEEIECRLVIGGQRRQFRGRVAWARAQAAGERIAPGAGIEFVDLDEPDRALLNELVSGADDGAELVDVWIEGLTHPLRMRGLVQAEELKLGYRLPRLREGSPLRVRFAHRGVSEEREGKVAAVKLLPGDDEDLARLVLQVTTPRPSHDQGSLGSFDDHTVIDRPLRHGPESVVVDQSALIPLDAREPRPVEDRPFEERTVIMKAPRPLRPSRGAVRAWQLATAAALAVGIAIGILVAPGAPAPAPVRPPATATVAAPAPRPAPGITIEPIKRKVGPKR
jgi:hypothetical protein